MRRDLDEIIEFGLEMKLILNFSMQTFSSVATYENEHVAPEDKSQMQAEDYLTQDQA